MLMRNNTKRVIAIVIGLVVIGSLYYWVSKDETGSRRFSRLITLTPEQRYLLTLERLDSLVVAHTATFSTADQTPAGVDYTISETVRHEYSISPNLRVEETKPASVSANLSDNASVAAAVTRIEEAYASEQKWPRYILYDREAGTTTTYENFAGTWTYSLGQISDNDGMYQYAHLWETAERPHLTEEKQLQARDLGDVGTYTFYFDDDGQLTRVIYREDSGLMKEEYEVLPELPIVSVPATVVDTAIEFQPEVIFDEPQQFIPVVSSNVYVPDMDD